ncbi:guanine nucleotide exchange factor MUK1 NDAI_0E02840 [Naumovozyma dairenensis CBS 421]|uniref:VPS9 domain-containing protein n=1 Tax=Naumovozyma dairenensis (strain ATCC 10597 / BCRC 20456 / CBS 421 / NBRC 0211 / NRRL Y-12639) TaxID=1071378 RepID=G0WBI1_NAUDC|nr:hypothetical protein NDAI_0E02840 [Naumovozyma dairenensis CBS 421]CCD25101.1 hypothetical protein NDAI_0E02840 [Naumovozyma dairenensis CBS 421]
MRQLFTPPISNTKFDTTQSIKESYKSSSSLSSLSSSLKHEIHQEDYEIDPGHLKENINRNNTDNNNENENDNFSQSVDTALTQLEIDQEVNSIHELPLDLSNLITIFIDDLKQPKYIKPLSIIQLASIFQSFYMKFDRSAFQYLTSTGPSGFVNNNSTSSFLNAKESLSSGLSGIFSRSRSSSGSGNSIGNNNNGTTRRQRRSSSLFSMGPNIINNNNNNNNNNSNNHRPPQQLLSPEEINKQLKVNKLNNLKLEKFMILCERNIFIKILKVGTAVPSPIKNTTSNSNNTNNLYSANTNINTRINLREFKVVNLFRNSPEFIQYDRALNEKINCLSTLLSTSSSPSATPTEIEENEATATATATAADSDAPISLFAFLDIDSVKMKSNESISLEIEHLFKKFLLYSISPFDKIEILLKIHNLMTFYNEEMSNDEFLSLLIYYIIKFNTKRIFLNIEFIKFFRYKKKLVENELYVLTNMEAALMFIDGLTINDFSKKLTNTLNSDQLALLNDSISSKIQLPLSVMNYSNNNNSNDNDTHIRITESAKALLINDNNFNFLDQSTNITSVNQDVLRSNSYGRFKTIFDSSLRNVIGKIKSYTPPVTVPPSDEDDVDSISNNSKINGDETTNDVDKEKQQVEEDNTSIEKELSLTNSPEKKVRTKTIKISGSNMSLHSNITSSDDMITNISSSSSLPSSNEIPADWKKFKDLDFEDLKISDLKQIFDIYQKIIQ